MKELINWFEIPANDIERAVNFYANVLEIELSLMDYGSEKMACFPDGYNISGAISQHKDFKPSPDGVMITFYAGEKMHGFLERVQKNGGRIIIPKTKIEAENRGYFATFSDSEGNSVGVYSDK
jgi:uncharacterized protein